MKRYALAAAGIAGIVIAGLVGCTPASDVASRNLSTAADNFEIVRRVTFINGITDKYLLTITGLCSLGNNDPPRELTVTCKMGPNAYVKHFLGLSDNVTYIVEQLSPAKVSSYQYRIIFRPQEIAPDINLQVDPAQLFHPSRPDAPAIPTPTP